MCKIMNINNYDISLSELSVHWVGNKLKEEGLLLSKGELNLTEEITSVLLRYFIKSFDFNQLYHFVHISNVELNDVYDCVEKVFNKKLELHSASKTLAQILYSKSVHPNIKGGELYVCCFENCEIDGVTTNAIGIFKSESKDEFLKAEQRDGGYLINCEIGTNIHKLDKGCIIYNYKKEEGYCIAVVDNTNKGNDAKYWLDQFLEVAVLNNEFANTQNFMKACKAYVTRQLPQEFDVTKADQAEILNKSVAFFKAHNNFDMEEFANEVIGQPEVIESFNQYRVAYETEHEVQIADEFVISDSAVKKQARSFKSVIKLDKNFHIYIHGDRKLIEQGEDEKGKYYKVYFKEEL